MWAGKRFIGTEDNWSIKYDLGDKPVKAMRLEDLLSRHHGVKEQAAVTPAQHPSSLTGKSSTREHGELRLNEFDLPVPTYVPWLARPSSIPRATGVTSSSGGTRQSRPIRSSCTSTTGTNGRLRLPREPEDHRRQHHDVNAVRSPFPGPAMGRTGAVAVPLRGQEAGARNPRSLIGLAGDAMSFDFHWCDNPADLKDPISLCTSGDSAPNRRFNYRCVWEK